MSRGKWAVLFVYLMSFSYQFGANPPIDYPRMLVSDTQQFQADGVTRAYVFEDQEILSFAQIVGSVYQSGMFYSGLGGQTQLPGNPSWVRIAAYMLNALAANSARLASVTQILDVKLSPGTAAKSLKDQAQAWLDLDDNSGAFAIIEQVTDDASFQSRWFKQWQRLGVSG